MPFRSPLWPIRFLVSRRFYNNLVNPLGLVMRLGGSLPVGRVSENETRLADELREIEEALKTGEVVAIFPEGKIVKQTVPTHGGRGTAYLAMKLKVPVIPFFVVGNEALSLWKSLLLQQQVILLVGEPFYLNGNWDNNQEVLEATNTVVRKIGRLYENTH